MEMRTNTPLMSSRLLENHRDPKGMSKGHMRTIWYKRGDECPREVGAWEGSMGKTEPV